MKKYEAKRRHASHYLARLDEINLYITGHQTIVYALQQFDTDFSQIEMG